MTKHTSWDAVVKGLQGLGKMDANPLDPQWLFCYNDGTRRLVLDHNHETIDDVLQAFEDFCKGAGFVFHGFAIVDEDGIPVNGLNPLAKLEAGDEDKTG
jgi:hypothetical protein